MPLQPLAPGLLVMASLSLFDTFADQLDSIATSSKGRSNLKLWIEKNVSHPMSPSLPWSWKHHEYQIQLVTDTHPWIATQKCAQSGVSELSINIALGLLSVLPNSNLIYSLQTAAYAKKFMTTRFGAAIDKSNKLSSMLDKEIDSSELKKLGSSYLHVVGAHAENQAISVPCSAVINDELSFSNPAVIGALMSRLEHLPEKDKTILQFSTPLYTNMGITEVFDHGTQHCYMCFHDSCGHWVVVNPITDLVIPGFDDKLENLTAQDISNGKLNIDSTYVKCSHCGNEISRQNLADPTKRAWVPKFLERVGKIGLPHSYQVFPTDISGIKTAAQIVRSLSLYKTIDRWFQYGIGVPYDSADGGIMESRLEQAFVEQMIRPDTDRVINSAIGIDVGKTSHVMVGCRRDGVTHIFWADKVVQDGDGALQNMAYEYWKSYGAARIVTDAAPDFTSVKALQQLVPDDVAWGAYFTRGGKNKAEAYEIKERDGMVAVSRTRMIDAFVKAFNQGKVLLPRGSKHTDEIKLHFRNVKRIEDILATGEDVSRWIATSPETHYFFAAIYLYTALEMVEDSHSVVVMPNSSIFSRVRMKTAA